MIHVPLGKGFWDLWERVIEQGQDHTVPISTHPRLYTQACLARSRISRRCSPHPTWSCQQSPGAKKAIRRSDTPIKAVSTCVNHYPFQILPGLIRGSLSLSLCLSQILKKLRLLNLGPKKKEPRRDHRTVVRADRTVVHACWMGLSKSLGLRQSVAPNIFAHSNFLGFLKRADGRSCWASLSAKHG